MFPRGGPGKVHVAGGTPPVPPERAGAGRAGFPGRGAADGPLFPGLALPAPSGPGPRRLGSRRPRGGVGVFTRRHDRVAGAVWGPRPRRTRGAGRAAASRHRARPGRGSPCPRSVSACRVRGRRALSEPARQPRGPLPPPRARRQRAPHTRGGVPFAVQEPRVRRDLDVRSLCPECLPPGAQLPLRDGHRGAVAAESPVGARERHLSSTPPSSLHGGREVFASDPRAEPRWPRWGGRGAADNPARLLVPQRTELAGGGAMAGAPCPGRQAGGAFPGARATSRRLPRPGRPGRGARAGSGSAGRGRGTLFLPFRPVRTELPSSAPWSAGREGEASPRRWGPRAGLDLPGRGERFP